jgi:hypothetical protein
LSLHLEDIKTPRGESMRTIAESDVDQLRRTMKRGDIDRDQLAPPDLTHRRPEGWVEIDGEEFYAKVAVEHTLRKRTVPESEAVQLARNEEAASLIANDLGLIGIVPQTVTRLVSYEGRDVVASIALDMVEPPAEKISDVGWAGIPDDEVASGALFDGLLIHADRHPGNAWSDERPDGLHLVLPDNEHILGHQANPNGRALPSCVQGESMRRGAQLPLDTSARLRRLRRNGLDLRVLQLLDAGSSAALTKQLASV